MSEDCTHSLPLPLSKVRCQVLPLYQDLERSAASHYICQVVIGLGYDFVALPELGGLFAQFYL